MKWMSQISVLLSTVKSFFQRDLVENYVINQSLKWDFCERSQLRDLGSFRPALGRLRSDHFLPIGAQSRLVMQFSALDWPADSGSELEGTVLVGGLVSMGVSVVPEASESGAGWLDVVLSLDSAPLPLTVSPTCNVHLKIETLKLSCNPWRLARLSSS